MGRLRTEEYSKFDVLKVDLTPHLWTPALWDTVPMPAMAAEPPGEPSVRRAADTPNVLLMAPS